MLINHKRKVLFNLNPTEQLIIQNINKPHDTSDHVLTDKLNAISDVFDDFILFERILQR